MWRPQRDPIAEELEFHFNALKQERLDAGDSEAQAVSFATARLGEITSLTEEVRQMSFTHRTEMIIRDARFAIRSYARHGGAYVWATFILAIGIGLSVAM